MMVKREVERRRPCLLARVVVALFLFASTAVGGVSKDGHSPSSFDRMWGGCWAFGLSIVANCASSRVRPCLLGVAVLEFSFLNIVIKKNR